MGMDVYGKKPKNEIGKYFRNNVWGWRPLWNYVEEVAPELAAKVPNAQYNDGDGLGARDSQTLAKILKQKIAEGHTKEFAEQWKKDMDAIPDEECYLCHGTGTRTDMKVKDGCNGCGGKGKRRPFTTFYPFSEENVKEFAEFVENSGGFEIN